MAYNVKIKQSKCFQGRFSWGLAIGSVQGVTTGQWGFLSTKATRKGGRLWNSSRRLLPLISVVKLTHLEATKTQPDWIIRGGPHLLTAAFAFCLLVLTLSGKSSILLPRLVLEPTTSTSGLRWELQCQTETAKTSSLGTEKLPDSCPFYQETAMVGLSTAQPVSHSNEPFHKNTCLYYIVLYCIIYIYSSYPFCFGREPWLIQSCSMHWWERKQPALGSDDTDEVDRRPVANFKDREKGTVKQIQMDNQRGRGCTAFHNIRTGTLILTNTKALLT